MKKLTKWGIVLAVITIVEASIFGHYNSLLSDGGSTTTAQDTTQTDADPMLTLKNMNTLGPNQLVDITGDHSQIAYIDSQNVLHVRTFQSSKDVYTLPLLIKPVFLRWATDDVLIIGTEVDNGNTKNLRLSTISMTSGPNAQPRLIHEFDGVYPTANFMQVAESAATNDVYVLIGDEYSTVLYHFDTMSDLNEVSLGGRYVSNVGVTTTTDILYFQDHAEGTPNVLFYQSPNAPQLITRNAVLLKVIGNALYYGTLNQSGLVTSIVKYQSGNSTTALTLDTPADPKKIFMADNNDVFVVSDDSYEDLETKKSFPIPSGAQTLIQDNSLFILQPGMLSVQT